MQKYTSANTSINKNRLPRIYNILGDSVSGSSIVDYGCGKYTTHIKSWASEKNIDWFGYDKYNQSKKENEESVNMLSNVDYVICSNVLNVVKEDCILKDIINDCMLHKGKTFFTVYEGDRSGEGKVTGQDQYQRNAKVKWYLDFIKNLGYKAKTYKGCIVVE